jgi:hypothetical protein
MDKITTTSTSLHTAIATDIVLRETTITRLLFKPLLVDNPGQKDASIKGRFVFQKKGKNENWEDVESAGFAQVKKGEEVTLQLKSAELLALFNGLSDLYQLYKQHGAQLGEQTFTKTDNPMLVELSSMHADQLEQILLANTKLSGDLFGKFLVLATSDEDPVGLVSKLLELSPDNLKKLNTSASLLALKAAVNDWYENRENPDEGEWQKLLTKHWPVVVQIFSWPVSIVQEKAFVGGKGIDNKGGGLVDYLVKNQLTNNVSLVEIKTPSTALVGKEYRSGVHQMSSDLDGGVVQILSYKQKLLQEYNSLGASDLFESFDPKCFLLIGHAGNALADTPKKRSFELFRNQLSNVQVITFDEMVAKAKNLIKILEGSSWANLAPKK